MEGLYSVMATTIFQNRRTIDPLLTVDNAVYTDPAVFDAEEDRIFAKDWIFVCHISELEQTGDFVTSTVAGSPIITTRGSNGVLRSFFNTCRHRGAQVVAEPSGNCERFRCPYHWWTYSLDGDLVGVPDHHGVYDYPGSGFDQAGLGLVPVRVDEACGLVFVCLDPDTPSLEEYLGEAVLRILHHPFVSTDLEVMVHDRYDLNANWKTYAENARDGYHVPYLHPLLRKASPPKKYELLDNGHAVQWITRGGSVDPHLMELLTRNAVPAAQETDPYVLNIYPHLLVIFQGGGLISIDSVHPASERFTNMESRAMAPKEDTPQVREERLETWQVWFANLNLNEDVPMLEQQQRGFGRKPRGVTASLINRDSKSSEAVRGDDGRLRYFWARWRGEMATSYNSVRPDWQEILERDGS